MLLKRSICYTNAALGQKCMFIYLNVLLNSPTGIGMHGLIECSLSCLFLPYEVLFVGGPWKIHTKNVDFLLVHFSKNSASIFKIKGRLH